jgi:hypothetical protein
MAIKAIHPSIDGNPKSYLTAKANSGQADLVVQNVAEFNANDYVVIGEPTQEQTEIKKISSISGNTITLSANLGFTHPENTKITYTKYNQVKFYRASTEGGSYSLISTKDLAIDEPHTLYDDTAGVSTDYYKIKYYNSYTTDLSPYSSAMPYSGFARYALVSLQDALYKKFGDKKKTFLDRNEITDWVNEGKDDLINRLAENNEKQFITSTTLSGDATGEVDLPNDFKKFQKVEMSYTGVSTIRVRARRMEVEDVDDTNVTYSESDPRYYFNNFVIGHRPIGTSSLRIYLQYVFQSPDLSNDSDTLPKPVRFYTHVLMDYLMYRAFQKDGKTAEADAYLQKYELGCERMIEHENNIVLDENREIREFQEDYLYV